MDDETRDFVRHVNARFSALEARMYVAEFIVANAQATLFAQHGLTPEQVGLFHNEQRERMAKLVFPKAGAARSDEWASELQTAMDDLLKRIESMHQAKLQE